MLSLGACLVDDPETGFYAELQPVTLQAVPEALRVSGLDLHRLAETGLPPPQAMERFRDWISTVSDQRRPVFVAFNCSFDWSFVNWYFHEFTGGNPFGIGGLDIKAYYMGLSGSTWGDTTAGRIPQRFQSNRPHVHNALDDAREQAEMFATMLAVPATPMRRT